MINAPVGADRQGCGIWGGGGGFDGYDRLSSQVQQNSQKIKK